MQGWRDSNDARDKAIGLVGLCVGGYLLDHGEGGAAGSANAIPRGQKI
jgi:hypothetical protein